MTRARLAAIAALSVVALLVTVSIGVAQRDGPTRATSSCKYKVKGDRDFSDATTEVDTFQRGPGRRGSASVFVPAAGVKVVQILKDRTPQNGNNIVDRKDVDRTNADGIAKTRTEFNNFGNYRMIVRTKIDGEVVDEDTITFGISDRVSGPCGPPLGAGEA